MNACEPRHRIATWRLLVAALLLAGGCTRVVLVTGLYEVIRQREYSPGAIRHVMD